MAEKKDEKATTKNYLFVNVHPNSNHGISVGKESEEPIVLLGSEVNELSPGMLKNPVVQQFINNAKTKTKPYLEEVADAPLPGYAPDASSSSD